MANTKILTWGDIISRFPDSIQGTTGPSKQYPTASKVRAVGLTVDSSIASNQLVPETKIKYKIVTSGDVIADGFQWTSVITLTFDFSSIPTSVLNDHPVRCDTSNLEDVNNAAIISGPTINYTTKKATVVVHPNRRDSYSNQNFYDSHVYCGLQKSTTDTSFDLDICDRADIKFTLLSGYDNARMFAGYGPDQSETPYTFVAPDYIYINDEIEDIPYEWIPGMTLVPPYGPCMCEVPSSQFKYSTVGGFLINSGRKNGYPTIDLTDYYHVANDFVPNQIRINRTSLPILISCNYSSYDRSQYGYETVTFISFMNQSKPGQYAMDHQRLDVLLPVPTGGYPTYDGGHDYDPFSVFTIWFTWA